MDPVPARAKLPLELLFLIIDFVPPANPNALIPASHSSTKTLLSLARVSRGTYDRATRILRQRCVYIDSSVRLAKVLQCMLRRVPTIPATLSLQHITSLYLAPFETLLADQPTARWVRELFCEVSETLRRLVIHMPFGSLDPLDDHLSIRRILRDGFEQLTNVEEFVSLGEYPELSVTDGNTDIWRLWPDLKRMALFGVPVDSHWLWWDIATLPKLCHVVLPQPVRLQGVNIKDQYFHKLPRDDVRLDRDIKVVLLDRAYEVGEVTTDSWKEIDPRGRMAVEVYEVPMPFYGDETSGKLVTEWVKRGALDGTLWEWEGEKVG